MPPSEDARLAAHPSSNARPLIKAGLEASAAEVSLLAEFATLWSRGLADTGKLWRLFDQSEMFLYRPDYFGAPVFKVSERLVTPVFSTLDRLTAFVNESGELGTNSGADGFDWVCLTGEQFFGLPVRARTLAIDFGFEGAALVDLASRPDPTPLAGGAPPVAINLELGPDGTMLGGYRDDTNTFQEERTT